MSQADEVSNGQGTPGGADPCRCVAAAWSALRGELRTYLRRRVSDAAQADDVLQDVFLKALLQGEAFCRVDNPRAWLYQVARHALIDRSRRARDLLPIDAVEALTEPLEAIDPIGDLAACVARTLPELPPADADILRACDLQGMAQADYAARQGLSLPAAKARLLRARRRLRERLIQACRVQFDPGSGRVCSHAGRTRPRPDPAR